MDLRYRVILSYLREFTAAVELPEEMISKEDKATQTKAVEKLIKDFITQKKPEYSDKVFAVGGHVRDELLGKNSDDIDLVVDDPKTQMRAAEIFARELGAALDITTPNNPHVLGEEYGIWGLILFNPKDSSNNRAPFIYDGVDVTGYILELTPPRR